MFTFGRVALAGLFLAALLAGDDGARRQSSSEVISNPHLGRPLALLQTRYRLRAGQSTRIAAAAETRDFILKAKTRRLEIEGAEAHGFVVGPSIAGDEVLLAASLTARPGEYSLTVSAISEDGDARATPLSVVLDPLQPVPSTATQPPVVLLNGWQIGITNGGCPISSSSADTFGSLESDLRSTDGVPVVYFFDNCVECPNCIIEELGGYLLQVLNLVRYDTGALVPQVDLVGHSMGGLIARAYLAGLQADGSLAPPQTPRVRKLVEIATPNFGSFEATDLLGPQTAELTPASAFLWNLATWNQRGDDLRGVDALAIVGNAGTWNGLSDASDGIVSLTSASLGFSRDATRTRVLPYCHGESHWYTLPFMDCSGLGIADVDEAPETGQIVLSFLDGKSDWMSIGKTPNQDPWLSQYGGIFFAYMNATGQYLPDLTGVLWGPVTLQNGGATNIVFYDEFVKGTGTFQATSSSLGTLTCGPFTAPVGYYYPVRCKAYPAIFSVSPLLSNVAGWVVQSGTNITITGAGFGQLCPTCGVWAYPGPVALPITSWSGQAIAAFLPATFNGYTQIAVGTTVGHDSIGIMAAPAPAIAVAPPSLTFQCTIGGASPSGQTIQLTNSGGGVLNWTATSSVSWLKVTPASGAAPSTLTVSVAVSGLAAGTYNGSIQISSAGASNTPVAVSVTLTLAPPPSLAVSPQRLTFNYTVGASLPAAQSVSVMNTGGGSMSWTASAGANWVGVSPPSGTGPATLSISVNPSGLLAGSYVGNVQITATGATGSPTAVVVTLVVQASPSAPTITAVVNAGSFQAGISSGAWIAIFGTNLASTIRTWRSDDFVNGRLPAQLDGVSAMIDGKPAAVFFVSPTQINVQVPDDSATGSVPVQVTAPLGTTTATAQMQPFSPGLFTFDGKYLAAQHADYSFVGKPNLLSGVTTTPAKPGEVIVLWGTGFGPSTPATPAGQLVTQAAPLANQVTVTVGGVPVAAQWAGISGAGLWQINVQVPSGLASGDALVVAEVGGVQTQGGAYLTVQ